MKTRVGIVDVSWGRVGRTRSGVSGNVRSGPPTIRGAELEAGVDVGEEGRLVGSEATVLEVVDAGDAAGGGDGLEKAGGGSVGVDAGGGEQADEAAGFDEAQGAFDEEGVEVDIAATPAGGSGRRRG